jgi:hypothetical protein
MLTTQELKDLILWAKDNKVKSISAFGAAFELSDLAFIENLQDLGSPEPEKDLSVPPKSNKLPDGNTQPTEDDELLYWSSRP